MTIYTGELKPENVAKHLAKIKKAFKSLLKGLKKRNSLTNRSWMP